MWGCEKKTLMPDPVLVEEINGIEYRYWNCPIKFIPDSIWQFITLYDYQRSFPSAPMPKRDNVSKRFLLAYLYYESKYNEFSIQAAKEK